MKCLAHMVRSHAAPDVGSRIGQPIDVSARSWSSSVTSFAPDQVMGLRTVEVPRRVVRRTQVPTCGAGDERNAAVLVWTGNWILLNIRSGPGS